MRVVCSECNPKPLYDDDLEQCISTSGSALAHCTACDMFCAASHVPDSPSTRNADDDFEGQCCVCGQNCDGYSGWKCPSCGAVYCDEHNCEIFTCLCGEDA